MQERDFEWYKENLAKLYEKYGDSVLAIKNQTVIGVYNSIVAAVRETEKTETPGTFIVQECGPDERAYTTYISSVCI